MTNDLILEVWNGTVYQEEQIESWSSPLDLKTSKENYNLFFVKYNKNTWSWKIFFEFTAEDNLKSFAHFNFVNEKIQPSYFKSSGRYFDDAGKEKV